MSINRKFLLATVFSTCFVWNNPGYATGSQEYERTEVRSPNNSTSVDPQNYDPGGSFSNHETLDLSSSANPWGPGPSLSQLRSDYPNLPDISAQIGSNAAKLTDDLLRQQIIQAERPRLDRSQYPAIDARPSIAGFAINGKVDRIFVNGQIYDIRVCTQAQDLEALIKRGDHRQVTGIPLPPGYERLYPEILEEIALDGIGCNAQSATQKIVKAKNFPLLILFVGLFMAAILLATVVSSSRSSQPN